MPRRKKKSSLARKPSLVFTESPVHVQNNVPSPVLCARHPTTASSVPVEDLHHLSWVSPQFQNVRYSDGQGKRRLTRQRRHSVAASHADNKENITNNMHNKLRKFNSLKFVGDRTNIPSIIEDIDVSIDEETETDNESGDSHEINEKDSPCDQLLEITKTKNKFRIQRQNSVTELEKTDNSVKLQDEIEGSCFTIKTEEKSNVLTHFGARFDEQQDSCFTEITTDLNCTRSRNPNKEKPPIKRLFASQLCGKDKKKDNEIIGIVNDSEEEQKITELNHNLLCVPDSDTDSVSSPILRRSERIQELRKMLLSSESPCGISKLTCKRMVLVPNTPENEYGWSKRKRQLITYIKKKS